VTLKSTDVLQEEGVRLEEKEEEEKNLEMGLAVHHGKYNRPLILVPKISTLVRSITLRTLNKIKTLDRFKMTCLLQ
jgi:hypothetical protein